MPLKPIKFGFKVFILADSHNGYLLNYDLYSKSKYQEELKSTTFTELITKKLLENFTHEGHTVVLDSFYTSPKVSI